MEDDTITLKEAEKATKQNVAETVSKKDEEMEQNIVEIDDEPLISKEETVSKLQEPGIIDIGNKMAIVYNVLKACIEQKKNNVYYSMDALFNRLAYLTKLPIRLFREIIVKTTENVILEDSVLETPDKDISLRRAIGKQYIINMKIPKSEFLRYIVNGHYFCYTLPEQLKRSGYIWRRLPNTNKAIIVEHPKRIIQRHHYLQKIKSYRKENRSLVYIDARIFTRADKEIDRFKNCLNESVNYIVVCNAVGNNGTRYLKYLNGKILFSETIFKCQEMIESHILKNVIPSLTEPSVIILEDKPYYKKSLPVPTIESEKSEMIKWLEINSIPHEKEIHRSELYELIQKCKIKGDLHKFDSAVYSHGHEILRRPTRTDYINYYKPLWDKMTLQEDVSLCIASKTSVYWQNLEDALIQNEILVFNEDLQVESITDKILTMANNTDVTIWANDECDEQPDSLVQEEYLLEVKNSFSPEELEIREREYLSDIKQFERSSAYTN